jgi:hypothetical protein
MNHEDYQQLASQFIDHELGPESEQEFFLHLGACTECREFLKVSWQHQVDILATKPKRSPSPTRTQNRYATDRGLVHRVVAQTPTPSHISTFALLLMVTLIVGILFSASINVQRSPEVAPQELVQPE